MYTYEQIRHQKAREMAAAQKVADWQIAAILNIGQRAKHPLFVTNVDDTRLDFSESRAIGQRNIANWLGAGSESVGSVRSGSRK